MNRTQIEVLVLESGTKLVRPASALGTTGFFPKAWEAGVMGKNDTIATAFLRANKNWMLSEIC